MCVSLLSGQFGLLEVIMGLPLGSTMDCPCCLWGHLQTLTGIHRVDVSVKACLALCLFLDVFVSLLILGGSSLLELASCKLFLWGVVLDLHFLEFHFPGDANCKPSC